MTDDTPTWTSGDLADDEGRDAIPDNTSGRSTALTELSTSRRRVLYGSAVVGVAAGFGGLASGQQTQTIELDGETPGWIGRSPSEIADQTNPTLELQAGIEYEVTWTNVDGVPHNIVVRDEAGEDLVRTELITEEGATQTVTFTATDEMSTYLCEVHPNSMVGDVEVSGDDGTPAGTETEAETPADGAGFFEPGTEVGVSTLAAGMTAPTDMAIADEEERYFVTDQTGEVWVGTPDDGRLEDPFLDVSDRMVTLGEFTGTYADPTSEYDERGLLGIELHPDFSENRRFFLHYSAPRTDDMPEDWDHVEVLAEFQASDDGTSADPDSEQRLLEIEHPQYNHDAGPFAFGPDGYLYFPMGDGGGRDDNLYGHVEDWYAANEGGNGQDVTENLLGSVIRIDVDGVEDEGTGYTVPEDNPFVGTDGLDEIYAYGFRNPFGFSFDSAGNLFIADAGQELWEEANVVESGGNYGWNVKEGTHCFSTDSPGDPEAITDCPTNEPDEAPYEGGPLIDPVVEFPHNYEGEAVGITIVGGHRYENDAVSDLTDKYVFGAWTTDAARQEPDGRVLAATPPENFDGDGTGGEAPTDQIWEMEELVFAGSEDGSLGYFVRMFGQDADGNVYVLANQRGVPEGDTGVVMQLVPPGDGETL